MADSSASFLTQQPSHDGRSPAPNKPTYSKRGKITIVACVPCRKRKTKCDGRRPICSQCQTRDSPCQYDMNEDQRRVTVLRELVDNLTEEKTGLESLLWHLKSSPENESLETLRRFRSGANLQSLLQHIQSTSSLHKLQSVNQFENNYVDTYENILQAISQGTAIESDEVVRRLRRREPIERISESINLSRNERQPHPMDIDTALLSKDHSNYHVRPMAGNVLAPKLSKSPNQNQSSNTDSPTMAEDYRWTTVTEDREFIDHLLDLYFMWQHNFFQNFPETLFRQDFESGRKKYCSRVLVNAICAAGCFLSDRPEARGDPNDPSTAGASFFEEGITLLNRTDMSNIPTTAGIFILSHVEGHRARLGAMWSLVGRSARMALDLKLHLKSDKQQNDQLSEEMKKEELSRNHAFWGCFVSDQVTSLSLGRLPQILTNAITADLPPLNPEEDAKSWGPVHGPSYRRPGARAMAFRQCASLSKVVNSTLLMFFAPSQIIKGSLLLDEYQKYLRWYEKLPSNVSKTDNAPAHVLSLHMYYHVAVLLLFRPFLRAEFTDSPEILPKDICRQSAVAISDLFAKHMSLYGVIGIYTFQIQCLLAACTIHLINLPSIAATGHLTTACNTFFTLVTRNTWAYGSVRLIRDLIHKWDMTLPRDVEMALYPPNEDLPSGVSARYDDPTAPVANLQSDTAESDDGVSASIGSSGSSKRAAFLNPYALLSKRRRLAPFLPRITSSRNNNSSSNDSRAVGTSRDTSSRDDSGDEEDDENRSGAAGGGGGVGGSGRAGGGSGGGRRTVAAAESSSKAEEKTFLFAPFPNQPAPLLGPIHTSTEPDLDWADDDVVRKVTRDLDGLRFEEGDGWVDPFIGIR